MGHKKIDPDRKRVSSRKAQGMSQGKREEIEKEKQKLEKVRKEIAEEGFPKNGKK